MPEGYQCIEARRDGSAFKRCVSTAFMYNTSNRSHSDPGSGELYICMTCSANYVVRNGQSPMKYKAGFVR